MIITEKSRDIILLDTLNPFEDILNPLNKRNRSLKKTNGIPIYFYRYIGIQDNQEDYLKELIGFQDKLKKSLSIYIKVTDGLKKNFLKEELDLANELWLEYLLWDKSTYRSNNDLNSLKWNENLNWTAKKSFVAIMSIFDSREKNLNETIRKNFGILMLKWIDTYFHCVFPSENTISGIPKFIYYGPIKRNEAYFLMYISMLGCDVLYINPTEDKEFYRIDEKNTYSKLIQHDKKINMVDFHKILVEKEAIKNQTIVITPEIKNNEGEKSYEELAKLSSSVVMIKIYDDKLVPCGTGSGVVIDEVGTIVTNFHVVRAGSIFGIIFESNANESIEAKLIKVNQDSDLALLKIDCKTEPIPINGKDSLNRGQQIVAIGSPLGLMNTISDGIVAGFRNFKTEKFIQITAPISPGSSGGALLDKYGYLVGITTAGYLEGQNLNLAVPSSELLLLLNKF
ncbi:MAG: trypsin-like peptidase domain-containing protein [Clostridiaceae bacterium]|nr:trypsin-like peptidase domain-containing protein [Clostridiaceae bacterium]